MRGAYGKYNVSFYYAGRLCMFFEVRLWLFKFAMALQAGKNILSGIAASKGFFGMTPQGGF